MLRDYLKHQSGNTNLTIRAYDNMDILYLLIPLSVMLVLAILGGLWWAIHTGQFEDVKDEGSRILEDD